MFVAETVKPLRPGQKQPPFLRLYLGGTPVNVTALEKFEGCIRGFKIGERLIDLQKASKNSKGGYLILWVLFMNIVISLHYRVFVKK
jgi:hypothetical protein